MTILFFTHMCDAYIEFYLRFVMMIEWVGLPNINCFYHKNTSIHTLLGFGRGFPEHL